MIFFINHYLQKRIHAGYVIYLMEFLLRKKYGKIAIFGGGHATVAFISILGIKNLIDFIIDDNPNKISKNLPAGNIPIIDSSALYKKDIKICLLGTNPQSHSKIINKHQKLIYDSLPLMKLKNLK